MSDESRQSRTGSVGEALAAFHERLAEPETPSSPSIEGLNADDLARVLRLQDCLVRLERARTDDLADPPSVNGVGSTAAAPRGSTFPSLGVEEQTPDATIGFSESDGAVAAADGNEEAHVVAPVSGPGRIGRFEILRVLGRGGQGLMLLAHDPVLARHVALKVPWSETLITPQLRRRFLREAQAVARLTHPHIVAVYEVGEVGPICFIASAFVEGQNLAAWLKERAAPIDPREAATIVADLAEAMHYAHSQGVLHRDLKPGNVLLEPRTANTSPGSTGQMPWVAKITDFGLAKILDLAGEETRTGAIIGTPAYMSPEQAKSEHGAVGPATDVYALGTILYEMLAGSPPFRSGSDAETLRLVVGEEPVPLQRVNPHCPRDLEAICRKCLEKTPAQRYASADELAADLRRFRAGGPTRAPPLSAVQRAARWSVRNRGVAAMLATIGLLLLGVTVVSTVAAIRIGRARDEAQQTAQRERAARDETARALAAEQRSLAKAVAAEGAAQEQRGAAETQAAKAGDVSEFLVSLFLTADPMGTGKLGFTNGEEVGKNLTLREVLDRGSKLARSALKNQPESRAMMLDTLGRVYSDLGVIDKAEPLVREAYELRQQHPENETDLATSLLSMGILLRWKGEFAESEVLLRRALDVRRRLSDSDSLAVADVEFALCLTLLENNRFSFKGDMVEFDNLISHVLDVQRRKLQRNHRDVGLTLTIMALRDFMRQDLVAMQKKLGEAALVFSGQEGGKSFLLGGLEFSTAALARRQRRFEDAERHYKAAIENMEKALGRDHLFSAAIKLDMAGMYHQQGRAAEFEQIGRDLLGDAGAFFRVFPQGHPLIVEPLAIWSEFVAPQGKYDEAIEFQEKIMQIEERFHGRAASDDIDHKARIAEIRIDQGRIQEAADLLDEVRFTVDAMPLGTGHESAVVRYRTARAALEIAEGDFAAAERTCREGPGCELQLGLAIHLQRPLDPEAERLIASCRTPMLANLNPRYLNSVDWYLTISQVLIDGGKAHGAESLLRPAYEFAHAQIHPGSYYVGWADSLQGAWLAAKGELADAKPLLVAGLENLRKSRGDHHRLSHEALDRLVGFYRRIGRDADAQRYSDLLSLGALRSADDAAGN